LAGERFLEIRYTWAEGGKPRDGMLLLGEEPEQNRIKAAWIDSWHMGDTESAFSIVMHNLSPDGEEMKAVETKYLRFQRSPPKAEP
jgi:hypothetical protein